MTNEEMKSALVAAQTLLVDKLGKQPYMQLDLALTTSLKWVVGGGYPESNMSDRIDSPFCDSPEEAFAGVMEMLAKMPSPEERDLREFQKRTAELIDFGNEVGIEAKFLNPITEMARDLAENALTHEAAQ